MVESLIGMRKTWTQFKEQPSSGIGMHALILALEMEAEVLQVPGL